MTETPPEKTAPNWPRDRRGRIRFTAEDRTRLLAEWQESGLSLSAFAAQAGVPSSTLGKFQRRYGSPSSPPRRRARRAPVFAEVQLPPTQEVVFEFADRCRLRLLPGTTVAWVAELIGQLR